MRINVYNKIEKQNKIMSFVMKITKSIQSIYQKKDLMITCGGPKISALDSGESGPGSSPGRGHCVVS